MPLQIRLRRMLRVILLFEETAAPMPLQIRLRRMLRMILLFEASAGPALLTSGGGGGILWIQR